MIKSFLSDQRTQRIRRSKMVSISSKNRHHQNVLSTSVLRLQAKSVNVHGCIRCTSNIRHHSVKGGSQYSRIQRNYHRKELHQCKAIKLGGSRDNNRSTTWLHKESFGGKKQQVAFTSLMDEKMMMDRSIPSRNNALESPLMMIKNEVVT